jgi:hypothetical protein
MHPKTNGLSSANSQLGAGCEGGAGPVDPVDDNWVRGNARAHRRNGLLPEVRAHCRGLNRSRDTGPRDRSASVPGPYVTAALLQSDLQVVPDLADLVGTSVRAMRRATRPALPAPV